MPSLHVLMHYLFSPFSLSTNILLIYCIFRHTPPAFATFGRMLLFHSIFDLCTAFGSSSAMQELIAIDYWIVQISYGPCIYLGVTVCSISYSMVLAGATVTFFTTVASLVFRFMVIKGKHPTTRDVFLLIFGIALPIPIITLIEYLSSKVDDWSKLIDFLPDQMNDDPFLITGCTDTRTIGMIIVIFCLTVPTGPLICIMIYIRSQILASVAKSSMNFSAQTKAMHRKLVSMLTAQALLPMLQMASAMIFLLGYFDVIHDLRCVSATMRIGDLSSLLSTLIVFFFIEHYRNNVTSIFRKVIDIEQEVRIQTPNGKSRFPETSLGIKN